MKNMPMNIVRVGIHLEEGCDWEKGDYSLHLEGFIGSLDLNRAGGVDDINLIKDAVENELEDIIRCKGVGYFSMTLREDGEWEDVFWHKYYTVVEVS